MTDHRVYFCITRFQLLCMIAHRVANATGTATLFVANSTFTDDEIDDVREALQAAGIFHSVRSYCERDFWPKLMRQTTGTIDRGVASDRLEMNTLPRVKKIVNHHFDQNVTGIDLSSAIFHVAADHYSFGLSLVFRGIRYVQFEDHAGARANPTMLHDAMYRLNPYQFKLFELLRDQRESLYQKIVATVDTNNWQPATGAPVEDLGLHTALESLPDETRRYIWAAFGLDIEQIPILQKRSTLLVTQPFTRWRFLNWGEQRELYFTLIDYLASTDNLVIKPHPQDNSTPYAIWFPDATVVPSNVPMELMLTRVIPAEALTVGSTAIFQLPVADIETKYLGHGFETRYADLHRIYAISVFLRWIEAPSVLCSGSFPVAALGSFASGIDVLHESGSGEGLTQSPAVLVVDDPADTNAMRGQAKVIVSLTPFCGEVAGYNEFRLAVVRQPHGRNVRFLQLVYIYAADADDIEKLKGKVLERHLSHLREDVSILFPLDDDPVFLHAKIASLESKLDELEDLLEQSSAGSSS